MPDEKSKPSFVTTSDFFQKVPPGQLVTLDETSPSINTYIAVSAVRRFCDTNVCNRETYFDPDSSTIQISPKSEAKFFRRFTCRHCQKSNFIVATLLFTHKENIEIAKLGEWPQYTPPILSRILSFTGPDIELFRKGLRAEGLSMGIAAYAYYRQVVENQKNRILDEIISVCKRTDNSRSTISQIEHLKTQRQFSNTAKIVRKALPGILMIEGQNPLALLHNALSAGLHSGTDEECLEFATAIRLILCKLCERIDLGLKDEREMNRAVATISKMTAFGKPKPRKHSQGVRREQSTDQTNNISERSNTSETRTQPSE